MIKTYNQISDTVQHEVGHFLGLSDIGFNPKYTTDDSMMSYNGSRDLQGLSDADGYALWKAWDKALSNHIEELYPEVF